MTDRQAFKLNGFISLIVFIGLAGFGVYQLFSLNALFGFVCIGLSIVMTTGFCLVFPNETKVLTFFGSYIGTIDTPGFWLTVPFTIRKTVSLKISNFNSDQLKVNDVDGNPVEIAAVVVCRVIDSAKATFDVDNYHAFIRIQSEAGLRHIASRYPYDSFKGDKMSLRGNADEVADELQKDLQERLSLAGVEVLEARLMHLAYAQEIAKAMLQRQQASAIIDARQKIVEGATSMVQEAIKNLSDAKTVQLSDAERAKLANNLMVSIVSDRGAQPVIDTSN